MSAPSPAAETTNPSLTYAQAGVRPGHEVLGGLLDWVNRTAAFRAGRAGEPLIPNGYFASVLRLTDHLALAIATDGVGSKILIGEQLRRYDTLGIDCIAMNVNDVLCVGAEPVAIVDYLAVNVADERVLAEIGQGLYEGARQAGVSIPGGELAQLPEMIAGHGEGPAVDLAATCVGVVHPERVICGQHLETGDVILGLRSNGIHSNGLTLARRALFQRAGLSLNDPVPGSDETIGEALLRPTRIYVTPVRQLLASGARVKALAHITGDGFLNLTRTARPARFTIEQLPAPQPIFELIQQAGNVSAPEMFGVFNMGIGFCVTVAAADADRALALLRETGEDALPLGRVELAERAEVRILPRGLVGDPEAGAFRAV